MPVQDPPDRHAHDGAEHASVCEELQGRCPRVQQAPVGVYHGQHPHSQGWVPWEGDGHMVRLGWEGAHFPSTKHPPGRISKLHTETWPRSLLLSSCLSMLTWGHTARSAGPGELSVCSEGPQKDSSPDKNGTLTPMPWEVNTSAPCTEGETETEEAQPGGTQVHQATGQGGGTLSSAKLPRWEWGREALPGSWGYLGTAYLSTVGHRADGPLLVGAPAVEPGVIGLLYLLNDLHDLGRVQPSCRRHVVLRTARHVAEGERLVLGVVQDLAAGVDGAAPGHVEVVGDKADDGLGAAVVPGRSDLAPLGSRVRPLLVVLDQAVQQRGSCRGAPVARESLGAACMGSPARTRQMPGVAQCSGASVSHSSIWVASSMRMWEKKLTGALSLRAWDAVATTTRCRSSSAHIGMRKARQSLVRQQ